MNIDFPSKISISAKDYHLSSALGSTDLKKVLRSVAHYRYDKENPKEPTKAMKFGTAFHMAALEPKIFKQTFTIMPEFKGAGSRAAKSDWLQKNEGRLVLDSEDVAAIMAMLKNISSHKTASKLLADGYAEEAYFWEHKDAKIPLKCKPDFLRSGRIVADLKTTIDASFDSFQKSIMQYKYHLSAAHYLDGISTVLGATYDTFLLIAVESEPPHAVQVFDLDHATLEKGLELRERAIKRLIDNRESKIPDAYSDELVPMGLPPWGWSE